MGAILQETSNEYASISIQYNSALCIADCEFGGVAYLVVIKPFPIKQCSVLINGMEEVYKSKVVLIVR